MGFSDDYSTRIHEASHFVAADFFHIPSYPEITPGGYSQIAESTTPHTAGLCHLEEPVTQPPARNRGWKAEGHSATGRSDRR